MPEGIYKLKALFISKSQRTNKNLARLRKQDLDLINGNGLIEEEQEESIEEGITNKEMRRRPSN